MAIQRSFGVLPESRRRELSGLELLEGIIDGSLPSPPISAALGFLLVEARRGEAVFEGNPGEAHFNPFGTVHGGYAATLLDSCMTCAVLSTVERGQGLTTVELKLNYVRAIMATTGLIRAGRTRHSPRQTSCHGRGPAHRCFRPASRARDNHLPDIPSLGNRVIPNPPAVPTRRPGRAAARSDAAQIRDLAPCAVALCKIPCLRCTPCALHRARGDGCSA